MQLSPLGMIFESTFLAAPPKVSRTFLVGYFLSVGLYGYVLNCLGSNAAERCVQIIHTVRSIFRIHDCANSLCLVYVFPPFQQEPYHVQVVVLDSQVKTGLTVLWERRTEANRKGGVLYMHQKSLVSRRSQ